MVQSGMGAQAAAEAAATKVIDGQAGPIVIDDAKLLTMGDYSRSGPDLTITGKDGSVVVVKGYFLTDAPPALQGPEGMVISGGLAERLAGPRVPGGQLAQAGDEQLAQAAPIGTIEKVSGSVTIERADGTVVEANPGDPVFEGDIVLTQGNGKIGLVFIDGSEFSLGGNGRMVLDEMVFDPNSGAGTSNVSLLSGTFSFISGQIAKASPDGATVTTPVATIGIRGTSGTIRVGGLEVGETEQLQVVLIPDPGGSIGEIIITTPGGQVTTLNVAFNGLNMVGGLIQSFTISAEDFVQEYGQHIDHLRSDFGTSLPAPTQRNDQDGDNDGQGPDRDQNTNRGDEEFSNDFQKVVLHERGHGIDERPVIVPPQDYSRPLRPPVERIERDGGFYQEDDETDDLVEDDDEDDVVDDGGDDDDVKVVDGTDGGDTLTGSTGADSINGGAGGDTLVASLGDDTLNGGEGEDWVSYESFTANLSIDLSAGTVAKGVGSANRSTSAAMARETGSLGTDTLVSIENITGGSGDDTFIGDASNNTFIGGAGRDTLSHVGQTAAVVVNMTTGVASGTGIGTDRFFGFENVIGGSGNDTFVGDSGNNTLVGGSGSDTVSFAGRSSSVTVNLSAGTAVGSEIGSDTLWGIENAIGGAGNDTFIGDAGDNAFTGGAGRDTVSYAGAVRSVTIDLASGRAHGSGVGRDSLSGIENAIGGAGNDVFVGTAGDNTFVGGAGYDTVSYAGQTQSVTINAATGTATGAGIGTDSLSGIEYFMGGSGNDTFIAGSAGNAFIGGAGSDTVSYAGKTGYVSVDLSIGYGGVYTQHASSADYPTTHYDRLDGIENVIGGANNDYFVGNASNNTIDGGRGTDMVSFAEDTAGVTVNLAAGTATGRDIGSDKLIRIENVIGGSGNDVLAGSTGQNFIDGGAGNDTIHYSGGGDYLSGGDGTDTLVFTGSSLSQDNGIFTNFEVIDLRGGAAGTLELSAFDVVLATGKYSGGNALLRVRGNGGDEVTLTEAPWTSAGTTTVGGVGYDVYSTQYNGYTVTVQLEQGLYTPVEVEPPNTAPTLNSPTVAYSANMDTNPGWSDLGAVEDGGWAWGTGAGSTDPGTGATGTTWVGFNLTDYYETPEATPTPVYDGEYPSYMPPIAVGTGAITLDGSPFVTLQFERWLGVGYWDQASVEVSIDGTSWTEVWANDYSDIEDSGWTLQTIDLSSIAGGQNAVHVRWVMGSDGGSGYGGWNIDDVVIKTSNEPVADVSLGTLPLYPNPDTNTGTLVSDLTANGTDADGDSLGIAIVGAPSADGTWEYSLDGGSSWSSVGAVSTSSAVVLDASARVRFMPSNPSLNGDVALTYHIWDGSDGLASGTSGVSLSTTGGNSAYSDGAETATVRVTPNTAPTAYSGTITDDFEAYEVIDYWVADLNHNTDISLAGDSDGPFFNGSDTEGYAIIGYTGPGVWQYSLDDGTTWTDMPAVSETSALLLSGDSDGNGRVRFVPTDLTAGGTGTLVYKAWDGVDGRSSGTVGVDTTNDLNNAFSTGIITREVVIANAPDWIGGTAIYTGGGAQWDTAVAPSTSDTAHIGSTSGETITFDGQSPFSAYGLAIHGSANVVVGGGTISLGSTWGGVLKTDAGTSLTLSGGAINSTYTYGANQIHGDLTVESGSLTGGGGYSYYYYKGANVAQFHDGVSGSLTLNNANFVIDVGSTGEFYDTTVTYSGSSNFAVRGTLDVAAGGFNTLDVNFSIGDRFAFGRQGEVIVNASDAADPTVMLMDSVYSYGTITFTSEVAGHAAEWNSSASYYSLYNRGGVIHATGAAGSIYRIDSTLYHQAHGDSPDVTGLIQVDSGVSLQYVSGNTLTVSGGADFLVDGTFQNDGTILFSGLTGTDLGGTGVYINNGTMSLGTDVVVTVTDAEILNYGTITGSAGSTLDLDAGNDGLHMGTLTDMGGTNSVAIGNSPGLFTIDGHYRVGSESAGSLYEIGGTQAGAEHDALAVTGTMHRGGTIDVTDWASYTPTAGDSFDIISYGAATGRFHHVEGLDTWLEQGIGMGVTVDGDGVTLTAHAVTQAGTAAAETLVGGAGRDVLSAGGGNDVLVSNGGNDLLFGGAGDDRFVVNGTGFNHVNGGAGTDTLVVSGDIDLSGLGGELFSSLERISMEGIGADHLILDSHIIQSMSRDTNDLIVRGAANDSVSLEGAWTATGGTEVIDGVSYSVWTDADSTGRVLVQDGVSAAATM